MTTPRRSCSVAAPLLLGAVRLLAAAEAAAGTDLSALPWDDLRAALSQNASLVETGPADYVDQCLPVFPLADEDRSHYDLVDQPAGVCMNQAYCGFKNCNPLAHETDLTINQKWKKFYDADSLTAIEDINNPSYNVPNYVLFPSVAGDVHAAVAFANKHKIEMSIKNSGHSYTGASTKADTLHVNMNHYRQYAFEENSEALVACVAEGDDSTDSTLAKQPCKLALARGKNAFLRVGGGENFDKVFRAVKKWNVANGYKHHAVGGTAGTVSPMGWTFQGGLGGATNGRTFGFGVDQILQIEAVLPLGHHVRFGPTQWETSEGFSYPKTTKVEGVCNSNPSGDESKWVWEPCVDTIDFNGLWFAMSGGGGGTYGLVTSINLQLHEYLPVKSFAFGSGALTLPNCGLKEEEVIGAPLGDAVWEFVFDFFLNPSALGVSDEDSNLCGCPSLASHLLVTFCYGNSADILFSSFETFLTDRNETLIEAGVSPASIQKASTCVRDGSVLAADDLVQLFTIQNGTGHLTDHVGKARDAPAPMYPSGNNQGVNLLMPTKYILENKATVAKLLNSIVAPPAYLAFGGGAATAHDQANSLSDAHRGAGMMVFQPHDFFDESFWNTMFPAAYPSAAEGAGGNFPGFVGSNHAGPDIHGPLKDDWTKPCDLNWTEEQRNEKCVSLQEAIWGTKTLARLEAVKDAVDPNGLLACAFCVGSNRETAGSDAPTAAPAMANGTLAPTDAPSAGFKEAIPSICVTFFGALSVLAVAANFV